MRTTTVITIACSLYLVGCSDNESLFTPAVMREDARPTLDAECYKQVLEYEISEGRKSMEEFTSAAENGHFGEYLATSDARNAVSDLDVCQRYAACDDVSDNERQSQIMQCTNQRLRQRMKDMGY